MSKQSNTIANYKISNQCKKYTDRSINEVYSKLLCKFSNSCGVSGKNGRKGFIGNKGDTGNKGSVGDNGEFGEEGNVGLTGDNGKLGNQGDIGLAGNKGENGYAIKGENGETGNQGNSYKGEPGSKGDNGENNNESGTKGMTGNIGNIGSIGDTGNIGNKGSFGDSGDKGLDGDSTNVGNEGTPGGNGDTGNVGSNGENGESGTKGDNGDNGDIGDSGISGDFASPFDAYLFGQNKTSGMISIDGTGFVFFPDSQIQSSGIIFDTGADYVFNAGGIYLVTYDIKSTTTFSGTTIAYFGVFNHPEPGGAIQTPYGYTPGSGFISFNRTFLFDNIFGGSAYYNTILTDPGPYTPLQILGEINGPQISIVRIA